MDYAILGNTGIKVSKICLGTMTWGEQNSETQAHAQLDLALDYAINFIDTAEMYPVPANAQTCGRTETYIGTWLKKKRNRHDLILASKVAGRNESMRHLRQGHNCLNRKNIVAALEGSLQRLQTDYVDLYQLHWPDRETNFFGRLGYQHDAQDESVPLEETLEVLHDLVQQGKVRYVGVSNETPWGVMTFLRLARERGWPRMQSIQNPYNLLNRTYEIGLAEIGHRENIGLLAYSPMGFGMLSGKYAGGAKPAGARLTLFSYFNRYSNPQAQQATDAYVALAREHGLNPAQMALAYVNSRHFLTATIIGATTLEQLKTDIESRALTLAPEVLAGIEAIHTQHPNPSP